MNSLFSPLTTGHLSIKNRVVMPPMCMYSSDDTGLVKAFHHHHYAARAMGGVGAIVIEATAVEKRGRISAQDLGLWSDQHTEGLAELVHTVHLYDTAVGIQLAHAGRKCGVPNEQIIAPSALPFDGDSSMPKEMTEEDIIHVVEAFKQSARRAYEAGFDFIEVHGAHGYLINTFLSPLTNLREDLYGLSHDMGSQFLRQILHAVREVLPADFPIWLRISAEEYSPGGNTPDRWLSILKQIEPHLIQALHVSSGGVVPAKFNVYPGYQIEMAKLLKSGYSLPVIGGGLITEPEVADILIETRQIDGIFLGRELLRNPFWVLQSARKMGYDVPWPVQYLRSK